MYANSYNEKHHSPLISRVVHVIIIQIFRAGRIILFISLLAAGLGCSHACERTIVRGVAEESKSGLVVNGVMILGLSQPDIDRFRGKQVQAIGCLERNHPFRIDSSAKEKKQGFDMPVLSRITSISIISQ